MRGSRPINSASLAAIYAASRTRMICLSAAFIVLLAACAESSQTLTGKVPGDMGHDSVGVHVNGDSDAFDHLNYGKAWCAWRGDHVVVGASLYNSWGADVVVTVLPAYSLENAGDHGDSADSDLTAHVAAGESVDWTGDAGHPEGGIAGTPITSCTPEIESVEAG